MRSRVFAQFARIGKALSSPGRLELLDLLCQGEKTVEAMAAETGMRVGNTSAHLRALRQAKLVRTRKEGLYVYYRVADPAIERLLHALRIVAERRLPELGDLAPEDRSESSDPVGGTGDALRRAGRGETVLLDVRPSDEYRAGHLPGARSIPLPELPARASELPRDLEITVYCRGPYSALSLRATLLLRERGYRAVRLREGVLDWRARDLPVEEG